MRIPLGKTVLHEIFLVPQLSGLELPDPGPSALISAPTSNQLSYHGGSHGPIFGINRCFQLFYVFCYLGIESLVYDIHIYKPGLFYYLSLIPRLIE